MTVSLHTLTVPVFVQSLTNLRMFMDRASDISEDRILQARLASDMLAFPGQIQRASDSAKNAVARLTGGTAPAMPDTETTLVQLHNRCQATIDYLQSVDVVAFDGAEARTITLPYPGLGEVRFTGLSYVTDFALPNFYFHVATAYGLLRAEGADLGKRDYLGHLAPS